MGPRHHADENGHAADVEKRKPRKRPRMLEARQFPGGSLRRPPRTRLQSQIAENRNSDSKDYSSPSVREKSTERGVVVRPEGGKPMPKISAVPRTRNTIIVVTFINANQYSMVPKFPTFSALMNNHTEKKSIQIHAGTPGTQ